MITGYHRICVSTVITALTNKVRLQLLYEFRTHWLMKKAIIDFLDQEEALEKRNLEADAALKYYQATGQFVSHENMTE